MADPAAVVGAVAACGAAGFSAATLWVSGRRDERKWRRQVLVDIMVKFFDGSFTGINHHALDARRNGDDMSSFRTKQRQAHAAQMETLTRLRLLSTEEIVAAAQDLHIADHGVADAILLSDEIPTQVEWSKLRREQDIARKRLLDAARAELGLGSGAAIGLDRYDLPDSEPTEVHFRK